MARDWCVGGDREHARVRAHRNKGRADLGLEMALSKRPKKKGDASKTGRNR